MSLEVGLAPIPWVNHKKFSTCAIQTRDSAKPSSKVVEAVVGGPAMIAAVLVLSTPVAAPGQAPAAAIQPIPMPLKKTEQSKLPNSFPPGEPAKAAAPTYQKISVVPLAAAAASTPNLGFKPVGTPTLSIRQMPTLIAVVLMPNNARAMTHVPPCTPQAVTCPTLEVKNQTPLYSPAPSMPLFPASLRAMLHKGATGMKSAAMAFLAMPLKFASPLPVVAKEMSAPKNSVGYRQSATVSVCPIPTRENAKQTSFVSLYHHNALLIPHQVLPMAVGLATAFPSPSAPKWTAQTSPAKHIVSPEKSAAPTIKA